MTRRTWRIVLALVVLVALPATPASAQTGGAELTPLPSQAPCVPWPTQAWPTAPIPAGVDAAAVEALGAQIVGPDGADSVVVVHAGRLVYERYADGVGPDTPLPSFSISKSFVATMLGMLVGDGTVRLDDRVPIEAWDDPADPRHDITFRHLVTMTSGLQWDELYGDESADPFQLQFAPDTVGFVSVRPLEAPPGTFFRYSTGDTAVLSGAMARAADVSGPSYDALLRARIFDPLGINPVNAAQDERGIWRGGSVTVTTTRNYAKLGHLYLRGGVWEGQQLLPRDWVDFVRTPALVPYYGAGFWLRGDDRFAMIGVLGQGVEIVPSADLVVAVNNSPLRDAHLGAMAELFENAEAPDCSDVPAAPPTTAPPGSSVAGVGTLPATGSSAGQLLPAGLAAVLLGALAMGVGRRSTG
jgi:CubicO group peptidase (beta-lactamase class C family)